MNLCGFLCCFLSSLLLLAAISLVSGKIEKTLPISTMQGDAGRCHYSNKERTLALENITDAVSNIMGNVAVLESCGKGLWWKVAQLNMNDSSQQCPSPWSEYTTVRSCGRNENTTGCDSVVFSTDDIEYSRVCGRAVGYQYRSPNGFGQLLIQQTNTPDDNYVDGVSVTHGSNPRTHIWTFAVGLNEANPNTFGPHRKYACPCANASDSNYGTPPPSYVGDNYFCESGHMNPNWQSLHYEEPLWDGKGCGEYSQCCAFNSPPWFKVTLPAPTRDHIEVRICGDQSIIDEDTTIEVLEIYIQ